MSDEPFDYGPKKANGQFTNHPSQVKPNFIAPRRNAYIHDKCGVETIMRGQGLIDTYATNPGYYGETFCTGCQNYFPVREFRWVERGKLTDIRLGEVSGIPGEDYTR